MKSRIARSISTENSTVAVATARVTKPSRVMLRSELLPPAHSVPWLINTDLIFFCYQAVGLFK